MEEGSAESRLCGTVNGPAPLPAWQRQAGYAVRFEWGEAGLAALSAESDVVVIVDVLSFCTAVDVAVGRGGTILPYRYKDASAAAFARERAALLAGRRDRGSGYSLSPASLATLPAGTRLVLPSPNGATLCLATAGVPTLLGCLRNAPAVAARAAELGPRVSVIAAGERWPDGSTRFAVEDLLGAGATLHHLAGADGGGDASPEARLAAAAFAQARPALADTLRACASGQELIGRGHGIDVDLAAAYNVSRCVPRLVDGAVTDVALPRGR